MWAKIQAICLGDPPTHKHAVVMGALTGLVIGLIGRALL